MKRELPEMFRAENIRAQRKRRNEEAERRDEEIEKIMRKTKLFEVNRKFKDYDFTEKKLVEEIFDNDLSLQFWKNQYNSGVKVVYDDGTCITTTKAEMTDCLFEHLPDECEYLVNQAIMERC